MVTISIQTEEKVLNALNEVAKQKQSTLEEVTQEALQEYLQQYSQPVPSYSFIGIGHSGKGNISSQVETTLSRAARRREGWSLSE